MCLWLTQCTTTCTTSRWAKPNCLQVTVSAHEEIPSLIEVVGLRAPPSGVYVLTADGQLVRIYSAPSVDGLKTLAVGYSLHHYVDGYYKVVVLPGTRGESGHSLYVCF